MYILRKQYLEEIRKYYDSNLIKVLTGIRRVGKSVLLEQIREELKKDRHLDEEHIICINFEDISFSSIENAYQLNDYISARIKDERKYYIFLDEIQHVKEFEKVLASLKATKNVSIFVTGSNSKLLSGRLASLLVGRCKEFKIQPFTYKEFLDFYQENQLPLPTKPLNNYIRYGGMPQRLDYFLEKDIVAYLSDLFNGIVEKDICSSKSRIDKETFLNIAKYIISNSAKDFSPDNIVDYYNMNNPDKIQRVTLYRYLEKMEHACLIQRVKRYDIASKRTLKSIEKQFAMDTGLILACSNSNRIFPSRALENLVYNELIYRGYEVKIGKTYKGEIDFVAMKENKKCFIQVAYLLSDEETIKREFSPYNSVRDPSPKYVMSLDEFDMSQNGITHINIEDWLLGKVDLFLS